jgi:hypothetical protein
VKQLLQPYKIGYLHDEDILKKSDIMDFSDMQKDELERSSNLVKH